MASNIERGCMMPGDMSNVPDKGMKEFLFFIKNIEMYYDMFDDLEPSAFPLCENYLRILN